MKNKLIKSFILLNDQTKSKSGSVFNLKKGQFKIGVSFKELIYENNQNGDCIKFGWLIENIDSIKIKEKFNNLEEKFEYIT